MSTNQSQPPAPENQAAARERLEEIRDRLEALRLYEWPERQRVEQSMLRDCHQVAEQCPWIGFTTPASEFIAKAPSDVRYLLSVITQPRGSDCTCICHELIRGCRRCDNKPCRVLLQQPVTSERCGECGHGRVSSDNVDRTCYAFAGPGKVCGCKCVYPATGAPAPAQSTCKCGATRKQHKRVITSNECGVCGYRENVLTEPFRGAVAAPASAPAAEAQYSASGEAWRTWFECVGQHATVDVVNATATLVIAERELCRPGTVTTSEAAMQAAQEVVDIAYLDKGQVPHRDTIAAIISKHLPDAGEPARPYFCSCGGALTAEEYIVHYFEKGHDRALAANTRLTTPQGGKSNG